MTVKAPQDGIAIYKSNWRGEKKKVGDSTWSGEKLLELPDLSEMKARAEVDEADAGRVAVGQKVKIRLEAHPDLDFTGTVQSIGTTVSRKGWRDPNKIYKVEIALDATDSTRMRPAMRFRGEIETGRLPSLLVAPRDAVFLRPTGPVVWAKRGRRYQETPVTLGRSNKKWVEVLAGLNEGDLVWSVDLRPPEPVRLRAPMTAGL
jgi:multidrug efflux pump subunit AcrA (membrane-fusion protein)